MKRLFMTAFFILAIVGIALLRPAVKQPDYSGNWYAAEGGAQYHFRDGVISNEDQFYYSEDGEIFSGAYVFAKDQILIFAAGIEDLDQVKQLRLNDSENGEVLQDPEDGVVYFYRNKKSAGS